MDRRRFLLTSLAGALAAPLVAEAQQPTKVPRVGVLSERSPTDPLVTAFRQGLRDLGYTEGQNIIVEYRYAHGIYDRYSDLAPELLRLKVDVLVVGGTTAAQSAKAQNDDSADRVHAGRRRGGHWTRG
jgi:ABC-type uncharacterized transport system substrate-binding protein